MRCVGARFRKRALHLFHDGKKDLCGPGDLLFVAAGTEHHFAEFTEDFTVWVIFYGPQGGEVPAQG